MTPEYHKLREEVMQRGWEIIERYLEGAFVIQIQQIKKGRFIGNMYIYSPDERERLSPHWGDILRLRFWNMVDEAEAELAKVA